MNSLARAIRTRHDAAKGARELARAIDHAYTPSMRNELIMVVQRSKTVAR